MGLPLKIQQITSINTGSTQFITPSYQNEEYLQYINSQYNNLTQKQYGVNRRDFIALALEEFSNKDIKMYLENQRFSGIIVCGTHNENLFLGMKYEVDILPSNIAGLTVRLGTESEKKNPRLYPLNSDFYLEKLTKKSNIN